MKYPFSPTWLFGLCCGFATAQTVLPTGTPLPVAIPKHLPMRTGEALRSELLYPVYVDNKVVLPAHTIVLGHVTSLEPDHARRVYARFNADFTPFHTPSVEFTSILLANGQSIPLATATATNGAPIFRLTPGPPRRGGFIHQQYQVVKQNVRNQLLFYTASGRGDRFTQLVYSQLPYHPERIDTGTAWTVTTTAPVELPADSASLALVNKPAEDKTYLPGFVDKLTAPDKLAQTEQASAGDPPTWLLEAYLQEPISSDTSHAGDPIQAVVAAPILKADGSVAVPQGSILSGTVTQSQPARRFSRAGKLRFTFTKLTLPAEAPQNVRTTLAGADSKTPQQLAMDSEGNVAPEPTNKVAPLIYAALAAFPLHHDRNADAGEQFGKNALASNSLGLIGFIVGTASRQAAVASAIGSYGAAVSIYRAYFAHGKETAFARNTRIILKTQATRSASLGTLKP
jgi:hypothetical protein